MVERRFLIKIRLLYVENPGVGAHTKYWPWKTHNILPLEDTKNVFDFGGLVSSPIGFPSRFPSRFPSSSETIMSRGVCFESQVKELIVFSIG